MAWVKLSDDFTEHAKILEAGPLASWLWVSAIAWSNRNGTDGFIPRVQIPRLASFEDVGIYTGAFSGEDVDCKHLVSVLVALRLFEDTEGGFLIHDYAEYQMTTDELERRRVLKAKAGSKGAKSRWGNRGSVPIDSTSDGNSHD